MNSTRSKIVTMDSRHPAHQTRTMSPFGTITQPSKWSIRRIRRGIIVVAVLVLAMSQFVVFRWDDLPSPLSSGQQAVHTSNLHRRAHNIPTEIQKSNSNSSATGKITPSATSIVMWATGPISPVGRKQYHDLMTMQRQDEFSTWTIHIVSQQEQYERLSSMTCGHDSSALERWQSLIQHNASHLATELFKYCALTSTLADQNDAIAIFWDLDASSLLVDWLDILSVLSQPSSLTILGDPSYEQSTIHSSVMVLQPQHASLALQMVEFLLHTQISYLLSYPLLLSRTLYVLVVQAQANGAAHEWLLLQQECDMEVGPANRNNQPGPFGWALPQSGRSVHHCPNRDSYCCWVRHTNSTSTNVENPVQTVWFVQQHPIYPLAPPTMSRQKRSVYDSQVQVPNSFRKMEDVDFIATVQAVIQSPSDTDGRTETAKVNATNLLEELLRNNCAPSTFCNDCLKENHGNCQACQDDCACYCNVLCRYVPKGSTMATQQLRVSPPMYHRDPDRIIPRLIHQFVPVDFAQSPELYPDLSRTAQSFRTSGWKYAAHLEHDALNFLRRHFPPVIGSVYQQLEDKDQLKRNLFGYCVLLIYGGLFADIDILLDVNIEAAIDPDVGFLAPLTEETPGCLWQGFIAAAPGHPFLAKAIENAVNQARNKMGIVGIDASYCRQRQHDNGPLYLDQRISNSAGSCILGRTVNGFLGRPPNESFQPGDVLPDTRTRKAESFVPGRIVILNGRKNDMGGYRFTLTGKNLLVAEVNVPVSESSPESKIEVGLSQSDQYHQYGSTYGDLRAEGDLIEVSIEAA